MPSPAAPPIPRRLSPRALLRLVSRLFGLSLVSSACLSSLRLVSPLSGLSLLSSACLSSLVLSPAVRLCLSCLSWIFLSLWLSHLTSSSLHLTPALCTSHPALCTSLPLSAPHIPLSAPHSRSFHLIPPLCTSASCRTTLRRPRWQSTPLASHPASPPQLPLSPLQLPRRLRLQPPQLPHSPHLTPAASPPPSSAQLPPPPAPPHRPPSPRLTRIGRGWVWQRTSFLNQSGRRMLLAWSFT